MNRLPTPAMNPVIATSGVISAPFIVVGALLGGLSGAVVGFALAVGAQVFAWLISRPVLLRACRAKRVDEASHPDIVRAVERLATAAQIRMPAVAVSTLRTPNAFAALTPMGGLVGVTSGAIELLSPIELEAVLAHEIAHLTHRERVITTVAVVFAALPGAVAARIGLDLFYERTFTHAHHRHWGGRHLRPIRDAIAVSSMFMVAAVVRFSTPVDAELAADRDVVRLTPQGTALVSALRKIDALAGRILSPVNPAVSHLLVVHPFSARHSSHLFGAHPSLSQRLDALNALSVERPVMPVVITEP